MQNLEEKSKNCLSLDPLRTRLLQTRGVKDEEEEKDLQPKEDEQDIEEEEDDDEKEQGQAQQRMQGHYNQHVQQQSQPNRAPHGRTRYTHLARALKERSKSTKGGEVVEVNGGHIAQAIRRKDRYSKVCTSKGPRDRRLRLAAQTAIQFYDVQDRLGFDRPSKAIDWLMEKAKAAIEALATANSSSTPNKNSSSAMNSAEQACFNLQQHHSESETIMGLNSGFGYQNQQHSNGDSINSLSFISEAANANAYKPSPSIHFHDHFPSELNSRTIIHTQDLCLSLQSFQDPVLANDHVSPINFTEQAANSALAGLSDLSATDIEIGWFQRTMMSWNSETSCHGGGEDFVFNSLPPQQSALLCQNQLLSHRGPLQSNTNNLLSVSARTNPTIPPISINSVHHNRSALSSQTSPRLQIEEQEYNATSERSSSTCSPCHY